ncbi:hypothetical protein ACQ4PT_032874 [Festuca glaucescens]
MGVSILPNAATLSIIVPSVPCGTALLGAKQAHGYAIRNDYDQSNNVVSALIDAYSKTGFLDIARKVFELNENRSTFAWTSTVSAVAAHGDVTEALALFNQMASTGARPDTVIFTVVLSACAHAGKVAEARDFFHSMQAVFGISPVMAHVGGGTYITNYERQVVWSANRDRFVRENATLELTSHGNLVLRDADGSHVWSSNSLGRSVAAMRITEMGNLELIDHRNATEWKSFDHPTDTLVPGQSLVESMRLTSDDDTKTKYKFYITVLPHGFYAFVESTPPQCYFSLMEQNKTGNYPTKVTFMNGILTMFGQPYHPDSNILSPAAKSAQFMRLRSDGHLRLYGWSDNTWTAPDDVMMYGSFNVLPKPFFMDDCDFPTFCGEYGVCRSRQCTFPHESNSSSSYFNLVSEEKFERLLVYEYMSRGSLDRWIYYHYNNVPLDWCTRCRIILDIAKGLCYLHEECRRKIAHLDIKPQNILLDDNFNAKVADFGLCKLINKDQSKVVTMMRGTPGYLAPEWLTSRITEKVDVYSFGVVIMEIVSGRKNIDNSQPEENVQLINILRQKAQNN